MSGLEDKASIAANAILIKAHAMGITTILASGLLAEFALSKELYMSVVNGTSAVAIDESLEIPHPTTSELITIGDWMREIYGDTFDSLPRITKEQFYSLE